jgi:8-oxo-dGTP pyrophosphatase MutT (NUDIX family)
MTRPLCGDFETRLRALLAEHVPTRLERPGGRAAAVLLPVIGGREPALIFTVRSEDLPSHQGQVSFPGGSIDPGDASPAEAALREAHEEVGLDPGGVEVIGELDTFPTYVSGFVVTPIVGWLARPPELRPNPAEVSEVLIVPIAGLSDAVRRDPGFVHRGRALPTEAWVWDGHVIWGVTARIVRGFLKLLANAGLTDPPGGEDWWLRFEPPAGAVRP